MKTTNENPIMPMEDQPAKPVYIHEQHNNNCQQFFGNVTGCVFAMPGATVYQTPSGVGPKASAPENATCNPQPDKKSIIDYVMKLHPVYVSKEWQDKYEGLWKAILELPVVAEKIYDKGRQQNTTFNRNLVGNILHLLADKKVLTTNNATKLAIGLEKDENASVRAKLGEMPPKEVKDAVEEWLKCKQ